MNNKQTSPQGLDELAAIAVRLGRELGQMADANRLGGSSLECGFATRTLRRLAARDPFDPRDDASLDALRGIIADDLDSEERGKLNRPGSTGGQNSRRIAHYGTDTQREDLEAVFV